MKLDPSDERYLEFIKHHQTIWNIRINRKKTLLKERHTWIKVLVFNYPRVGQVYIEEFSFEGLIKKGNPLALCGFEVVNTDFDYPAYSDKCALREICEMLLQILKNVPPEIQNFCRNANKQKEYWDVTITDFIESIISTFKLNGYGNEIFGDSQKKYQPWQTDYSQEFIFYPNGEEFTEYENIFYQP